MPFRIKFLLCSLAISFLLDSGFAGNFNIIPQPVKSSRKCGYFHLKEATTVLIDPGNAELKRLALFFTEKIRLAGGPSLSVKEKIAGEKGKHAIQLTLQGSNPAIGNEGYEIRVRRRQLNLHANTTQGIFYGIQSLFQLLPPAVEGKSSTVVQWKIPCCTIKDFPRFPYRGLHLDVCRHFFPVEFIKEYIDLLAMYKMNTFHWHLTDDQGWRIEIKKYPLLTSIGAYRKGTQVAKSDVTDNQAYGDYYTRDQIRDIVQYAKERYINVIPEIEMPGHAIAALTAYPQYSCTGGPFEVRTSWGVSEDIFCPGKDSTFIFLQDILAEVMQLFPSRYIHIGGDEAPKSRWVKCPLCQKRMKVEGLKDEQELQSYFIRRIQKFLDDNGRKMIGWDEILEGGLAPEATVMSWRGVEGGIEAARLGHDVIMTPGAYCYFDHYQADPAYEPLAIGGFTPLKKVYSFEAIPAELTAEEGKHILGAQGNLWTEYIEKGSHVTYMAYPRAIALAETDWSPLSARDWDNFVQRLENHFIRLDYKGVNYCKSLYDVNINTQVDPEEKTLDVKLTADWKEVDIRYTLDGSEPCLNAAVYKKPFPVLKTSVVRTAVFTGKEKKGRTNEKQVLVHKAAGKKVLLLKAYSDKYPGKGDQTVTDGLRGSVSFRAGEWQGYHGNNFEAVIDLGELTAIHSISATFMKNIYSWIHLPYKIEYQSSTDGIVYTPLGILECSPERIPGVEIKPFSVLVPVTQARFIKITAYNPGINPPWHEAAGQPCWIFVDEVVVE